MPTATDLCLHALAQEAGELRAALVIYRELAFVALEQLAEAEDRQAALSARLAELREDLRRYTAAQVVASV